MQRYNMFNQVHKGLRALLYETALQIQHTDFCNVDEAAKIITRVREVTSLFDKHAHTEDHFVFPAVSQFEPSVADSFEQEHVKDHMLGQLLEESLALYGNASVITEKAEAGRMIQSSFMRFMVFNLEHMAKEEDILNRILWRYYSDAELIAMTGEIVAAIPPDVMAVYSKWMLRGLNNTEIITWLREVEEHAPEFVSKGLFAAAEQELPAARFRQVLEGLSHGAMLA